MARLALPQLGEIGGRMGLDRGGIQLHPGAALAGGITDASREVADDQHRRVAGILKGAQLAKQNRVPQVDFGAGGIDAQLHPQWSTGSLCFCQARRQLLIRITAVAARGEQIGQPAPQPVGQCLASVGGRCSTEGAGAAGGRRRRGVRQSRRLGRSFGSYATHSPRWHVTRADAAAHRPFRLPAGPQLRPQRPQAGRCGGASHAWQ